MNYLTEHSKSIILKMKIWNIISSLEYIIKTLQRYLALQYVRELLKILKSLYTFVFILISWIKHIPYIDTISVKINLKIDKISILNRNWRLCVPACSSLGNRIINKKGGNNKT